ncbi:MAG TPA: hypothetical protein VND64_27885 [Pirellulales bacterium]|nr:hypothetical protein [Pirellulales bacterium]
MAKPLAKLVALLTPKRRWAQFSLATMFVVVTLCCVGVASLGVSLHHKRRDRAAVAALRDLRFSVQYDWEDDSHGPPQAQPPGPRWARRWLGDDFFADVTYVSVIWGSHPDFTDEHLASLRAFPRLESLRLSETAVSDAGLAQLTALPTMKQLDLSFTHISDTGLAHVTGLTGLEELNLMYCQVTDRGLAHLKSLAELKKLSLKGTLVTDEGVAELTHDLPNCKVYR